MSELKKYPNINEKVIKEHGLSKDDIIILRKFR